MKAFLERVAETYLAKEHRRLGEYCFVFPNKRSGTFFRHFLLERREGRGFIFPDIKTISEFVADFSHLVEATRYEQLFLLYNEYKKLSKEISDFDKFLFWGDMLINDFNDVDRYLVDPKSLFTNVRELKEINSTYLTPEQLEIIREFWGEDAPQKQIERFWTHIHFEEKNKDKHETQTKFRKLWEILYPLFTSYKKSLTEKGLSTNGMYFRNAVEYLSVSSDISLPYERYVFVGFNVLSTSEIKIFSILKKLNKADFYWDFNSPAFKIVENRATKFIEANIRRFPSLHDIDEPEIDSFPDISIVGVPSNVGQAKYSGQQLAEWIKDKIISEPENAVDTAVILPDESLFIPMIHSVPEQIKSLNITMGFPMRYTPVASVLKNIVGLQVRARNVKGNLHYFFEDVRNILSQPIIRSVSPSDCDSILKDIKTNRRFTIDAEGLSESYPSLSPIFLPVDRNDTFEGAYRYIRGIIEFLISHTLNNESSPDVRLQIHFLTACRAAVENLLNAEKEFGIEMRHSTFFHLFERAISSDSVNFVGEPLKGMQIMGVLETRSLDFNNIIMLSMNENKFPRKQYTASFIPDTLRRGFGMATMEFQETIFAYYFYRLISRAKNVTLIYDARTIGGKGSEMSRYLAQLLYIYNYDHKTVHKLAVFPGNFFEKCEVTVQKSPEIMKKMEVFTTDDPERARNLSASAINDYIACPLKFYLRYVENIREEDEVNDYMDSSTLGTIVHSVAQRIYETLGSRRSNVKISPDMLRGIALNEQTTIEKYITEEINYRYLHLGRGNLTPLTGESLVIGRLLVKYLRDMLIYEANRGDSFIFVKAEADSAKEFGHPIRFDINDSLTVNLRRIIDRIDRLEDGSLRFIDYKTGRDPISAKNLADLVNPESPGYAKAIFQLMLYCNIYRVDHNYDGPIQPVIYSFSQMAKSKSIRPISIGKTDLTDYRTINEEYLSLLKEVIEDMFNPDIPFTQASGDHSCKFCKFKSICGRKPKDY